jgi:hypothetical protein
VKDTKQGTTNLFDEINPLVLYPKKQMSYTVPNGNGDVVIESIAKTNGIPHEGEVENRYTNEIAPVPVSAVWSP